MMGAAGARIGEVLALRWADIDFNTRGRRDQRDDQDGVGCGDLSEAACASRLVALPESAAVLLQSRRRSVPDNFLDAVFTTRNVTWQQINNVERRWRQIRREAGLEWDHHRGVSPQFTGRWAQSGLPA
jgi:integrase